MGRKLSEETKRKISQAKKGKPLSIAHRKALSDVKKKLFAEGKLKSPLGMKGKKHSEAWKQRISRLMKGTNKGPKNGQWKGGSWKFRAEGVDPTEYRRFKRSILKRDGKCLMCYSTRDLQVHHIIPVHEDRTRIMDKSNVMVLCKSCHIQTHNPRMRGAKKYLIEYFETFLERLENEQTI